MSTPPPAGWPPGPPPNAGQPYGQQGFNPQQPAGWQQGSWPQQAGPPPQKGSGLKWLLIAVAVLLVVAISVGATLIFTRDNGGGGGTSPSSAAANGFASAGDTGPVAIITDEPTCVAMNGINSALADVQANGWSAQRATLGPSSEWSAAQRSQVQAVATAMKNASDQVLPLAKQTPHRVVRELYEQFIVYGRAYAATIPDYRPGDDALATVNVSIGTAMIGICNAIQYGSVGRALAVEAARPPTSVPTQGDPSQPERFVNAPSSLCTTWTQRETKFVADTAAWGSLDTELTSAEWTPEQRDIQLGVLPVLDKMARDMETAGRTSGNPPLEDFAVLGSLYFRAYISAGDSYTGADSWLSYAGSRLNNVVGGACSAVAE